MAKANKVLTLSYGMANYDQTRLLNYLDKQLAGSSTSYSAHYSHPVQLCFDAAISDYTTLGIGVSYFTFDLKEKHDTIDLHTKGQQVQIQLRAIRYFYQRPRSVAYLFAGIGGRFREGTYNSTDSSTLATAAIHHFADASQATYFPLSVNAGLGFKGLVTRTIGISLEVGVTTGIAQAGLFYSFKNKWRRHYDGIGW